MNKIILLILITVSCQLSAGEEQGTGEPINNSVASTETIYQLICTPASELNSSTQQDNNQYCMLVPISTDS